MNIETKEKIEQLSVPLSLEEAKEKFGAYAQLIVPLSDGTEISAFLRKPGRKELGVLFAHINTNLVKGYELLLQNIIIKEISDMRILTDDDCFVSAFKPLSELIEVREGTLKKS